MAFSERKDSLERIAIYDNPFKQQQDPTPDPQPDDVPTYTLTKNGGMYFLNNEPVSVEIRDNGATVLVPFNHDHTTQIYLKFTCDGYTYTYVKSVIRLPCPICSINQALSHRDDYSREPPDK